MPFPPDVFGAVRALCFGIVILMVAAMMPVAASAQADAKPPNVVMIVVDDLDVDLFVNHRGDWPAISRLVNQGTWFTQAHVTASLCGPSRASLLTSQAIHNTEVRTNGNRWESGVPAFMQDDDEVPSGGFDRYISEGLHNADLPRVMSDNGYQTGLVGKYLHTGFPSQTLGPTWYPESWDEFHASLGDYWDFRQLNNGTINKRAGFRTDIETRQAVATIKKFETSEDPWMLYLAPFGPHTSPGGKPMYAPRHASAYAGISPDFAPDLSLRPPLGEDLRQIPESYRQRMLRDRLRSMLSVEEMVASVLANVDLAETVVMFTSDNGIQLGGRGFRGKNTPYARSTRVPLVAAGPGFFSGEHRMPVSLADLLPTVRDIAGLKPDFRLDGVSLLAQRQGKVARDAVLSEGSGLWPQRRNLVLNLEWTRVTFSRGFSVIKWATGAWEAFSNDDLHETNDLWRTWDASTRQRLQASVQALAGCQGAGCATTTPSIVITAPQPGLPQRARTRIRGAAYAPAGRVGAVTVSITRRDDGRSLNRLGKWVDNDAVALPAVVRSASSDASFWHLDVDTLPPSGVTITATMRSGPRNGLRTTDRVVTESLRVEDRPATVGAQPRPGLVQGWVADADGVAQVLVNGRRVDALGPPTMSEGANRRAFSINMISQPETRLVVTVRDTRGNITRSLIHRGNRAFPNWAR